MKGKVVLVRENKGDGSLVYACKLDYKGESATHAATHTTGYMYIHKYIVIPLDHIRPLPAPNIFLELEMLLPKLRLMLSELRGRLELVGFMGDNIDGINELPELAPVYR